MSWSTPEFCLGVLTGILLTVGASRVPAMLLPRLHYRAWRAHWARKSRRRHGGRPTIGRELIALIRRMSAENPRWGAPRIHGELLKLGYAVAQSTVAKYMVPRGSRPVPGWATFLRNEAKAIAAIDMLSVPTLTFGRLYVVVVLGLGRRAILHVEVTDHPTARWLAAQVEAAFAAHPPPLHLIRDNDGAYGRAFRDRIAALGIRDRPIAPYSPWQNGYVERVIGSIKRECLDTIIAINAAHLRCVLAEYVEYYNEDRPHLSLNKDSPHGRAIERDGRIVSRRVLGGLHHRYSRKARK